MAARGLEARYRGLLRWFPREHRERHGEEMVGVLLAAAPSGRDRPSAAETADLLRTAVRLRLRPGRALIDRGGWRDMLAMYSVAAPLVATVATAVTCAVVTIWSAAGANLPRGEFMWSLDLEYPIRFLWLVVSSQLVVTVLALLGLRRWAAAAVAAPVAYQTAVSMWYLAQQTDPRLMKLAVTFLPGLAVPAIEIVALLASPGPRHGRQIMQRRHWVAAAGFAFVSAVLAIASYAGTNWVGQPLRILTFTESSVLALVATLAWLTSGTGKRLAVIIAVLSCSTWETLVYWYGASTPVPGYTFGIVFDVLALGLPAALIVRKLLTVVRDSDKGIVA
jgi:hypothetical protein